MTNKFRDMVSIGRVIAESEHSEDEKDIDEVRALEKSRLEYLDEYIKDLKSNREMRIGYERKVYWFLVGYTACAFGLIIASGAGILNLPSEVLVTIAGSTAVSAIGLVRQVGIGLFGTPRGGLPFNRDGN